MSVSYSVDVTLDLVYTEENIQYILTRGMEEGFIYLNKESQTILSIHQAIQESLYPNPESGVCHVAVKFQDTMFFVWFFKSDNDSLIFSIGSFSYKWDRDFSNGKNMYLIDFARYIRLMLQVCKGVSIVEVSTVSDTTEDLVYRYKNCVVAVVDMGDFGEKSSGYIDEGKSSVEYFIANGIQNGLMFIDENTGQSIEPSVQKYYAMLHSGLSASLYAKKDDISFKIEIVRTGQGYDCVAIYPLESYSMKKAYGNEGKKIDVAFYVQRLIEVCENFAIYELKTFFNEVK